MTKLLLRHEIYGNIKEGWKIKGSSIALIIYLMFKPCVLSSLPWGYTSTLWCRSRHRSRKLELLCLRDRRNYKHQSWRAHESLCVNSVIGAWELCGIFPPDHFREWGLERVGLATRHFLNSVESNCQSVWTGFGSNPTCWLLLMVAKILILSMHSLIQRAPVLYIDFCSNFVWLISLRGILAWQELETLCCRISIWHLV